MYGLHNNGQTGGTPDADIDAPEAWDTQSGSEDVLIAVIDTGVDYNHEDLLANMWTNTGEIPDNGADDDSNGFIDDVKGWDFYNDDNDPFDDHGHGTHISGTIGAVGDNGIGVAGVNWSTKIMPLKCLGANGSGTVGDAIAAIGYAISMDVDILNNSWGWYGFSQALKDVIETANSAGILFVAAAGNNGRDHDQFPYNPAAYDNENIVSVAATNRYDDLAFFSNYGETSVDLAAPGVNIYSTLPINSYGYKSGTSMATPHVSGVAGLIKAQFPELTSNGIKARLLYSVDPIPALEGKTVTGGRLNAYNSLEVDDNPPVANAGGPYTGNEDIAVTSFDGSGSYDDDGDTLTYDWDFGDGTLHGSGVYPSHTYTAGGIYTVTLIVNDGNVDSPPDTTTADITEVNNPPVADAGEDQTAVVGEVLTFDGSGSYDDDGDTLTYDWDFGDGTTGAGMTITHSYLIPGNYIVSLTVEDNDGAIDLDTMTVNVEGNVEGHVLSKNPDYSSNDRVFTQSDSLYVKVMTSLLDYNKLKKTEVELRCGKQKSKFPLTNNYDGTYTGSKDLSNIPFGDCRVNIKVEDINKKRYRAQEIITIITSASPPQEEDTPAPNVSIISPEAGSNVRKNVDIKVVASHNVGVSRVEFYIDNVLKNVEYGIMDICRWKWDTRNESDGEHSIMVKAYDEADNVGTDAISVYK